MDRALDVTSDTTGPGHTLSTSTPVSDNSIRRASKYPYIEGEECYKLCNVLMLDDSSCSAGGALTCRACLLAE